MSVFDTVQRLCKEKGLSIRQLEVKAGIGNGTIGKWRVHEQVPTFRTIEKVADALDMPVTILVDIITEEKKSA